MAARDKFSFLKLCFIIALIHCEEICCCFCLVTRSCPALCYPMDCSTPGFHILHHLPEFVQVHVHWISAAILPSHPLSPTSPSEEIQFSSVQLLNRVWLFATPWTAARQAYLSITNCRSLPKPMSIESMMPSNHLSSVIPFSSCPQSFPASGSFQMSQLFASGGDYLYSMKFNRS